jgi:hypothetical protein
MLPPTYCTCMELFEYGDPGDALAAAPGRDLTPVAPEAVRTDDGAYLSIPERLVELGRTVKERMGS